MLKSIFVPFQRFFTRNQDERHKGDPLAPLLDYVSVVPLSVSIDPLSYPILDM